METLPVIYCANRNAWMTSRIFQQWITHWDVALIREKREILVLVDNCPAHPNINSQKILGSNFSLLTQLP